MDLLQRGEMSCLALTLGWSRVKVQVKIQVNALFYYFKQDSPSTPALWLALIWCLASSSHCYCSPVCRFLTYCPSKRILSDEGLKHEYFRESPLPIDPSMFPTWPAKSEQQRVKRGTSPRPPEGGLGYSQLVSSLHPTFSVASMQQVFYISF